MAVSTTVHSNGRRLSGIFRYFVMDFVIFYIVSEGLSLSQDSIISRTKKNRREYSMKASQKEEFREIWHQTVRDLFNVSREVRRADWLEITAAAFGFDRVYLSACVYLCVLVSTCVYLCLPVSSIWPLLRLHRFENRQPVLTKPRQHTRQFRVVSIINVRPLLWRLWHPSKKGLFPTCLVFIFLVCRALNISAIKSNDFYWNRLKLETCRDWIFASDSWNTSVYCYRDTNAT